jgi:hypothetical protein
MRLLFLFFMISLILIPSGLAFFEDSTLIPMLMPIYISSGSGTGDGNNYPTSLTINRSTYVHEVFLNRSGLPRLSANFTGGNMSQGITYNTNYYAVASNSAGSGYPARINAYAQGWGYGSYGISQIGNAVKGVFDGIGLYSFIAGQIYANNTISIERDGTPLLTGTATVYNIEQRSFIDNNYAINWDLDKTYGTGQPIMSEEANIFFTYTVPHYTKTRVIPTFNLHYINQDGRCNYDFRVTMQYADPCLGWTSTGTTKEILCRESISGSHCIDTFTPETGGNLTMEGSVIIELARRFDGCAEKPIMLQMDMETEQDTIGSRQPRTK